MSEAKIKGRGNECFPGGYWFMERFHVTRPPDLCLWQCRMLAMSFCHRYFFKSSQNNKVLRIKRGHIVNKHLGYQTRLTFSNDTDAITTWNNCFVWNLWKGNGTSMEGSELWYSNNNFSPMDRFWAIGQRCNRLMQVTLQSPFAGQWTLLSVPLGWLHPNR